MNNKLTNKNKIGNLSFINSLGKEEITKNDTTKSEILNSFFSSVLVKEQNTNVSCLNNIPIATPMEHLIINQFEVLKN